MISNPCTPQYEYRPTSFVAGVADCVAPVYAEHRSRLTIGNCFFRSIAQGPEGNAVSIECVELPTPLVRIYFNAVVIRTFSVIIGYGGIADLRAQINYDIAHPPVEPGVPMPIEMPAINYDIFDARVPPEEVMGAVGGEGGVTPAVDEKGLEPFIQHNLSGGSGGPTSGAGLASIRTGPERTIFILSTTEDATGAPITPPASKRIKQWNGEAWISYCNLAAGECPLEGLC